MKIEEDFTPELKNKSSQAFKTMKKDVEDELLPELQKTEPAIGAVDVKGTAPSL